MRVALCKSGSGIVDRTIEILDLDTAERMFPDFDAVEMDTLNHPAEPGCAYERRTLVCRFTRADGLTRDTPRAKARIATR